MTKRHVLSLHGLGTEVLTRLIDRSVEIASSGRTNGYRPLLGRSVGIYFPRPSTRTRTSFTIAALKLGANTITYGSSDLQVNTGESLEDTGKVLSCYLDALVIRTNDSQTDMEALARQDGMAVINAMSAEEHPTQAIADLSTIKEHFGRVDGVHLLYLGEGNNSASALAYALSQFPGTRLTLMTPEGYGLKEEVIEQARSVGEQHGSVIEQLHDMRRVPRGVDVVYTTRWNTMGVSKADPDWVTKFRPFGVTAELMKQVSKPEGTIFMHDLPAMRGQDVDDEVLDGPQSLAWRQASFKMSSAAAVLEWCLSDDD